MEKAEVVKKYEDELAVIKERIAMSLDSLHDALLGVGQHSVKDMSAAIVKYEDEARLIQICLDALRR